MKFPLPLQVPAVLALSLLSCSKQAAQAPSAEPHATSAASSNNPAGTAAVSSHAANSSLPTSKANSNVPTSATSANVPASASNTASTGSSPVLMEQFDQQSCLRQTGAASLINGQGELVLSMYGGMAAGLTTRTELGYGRYSARIKTDIGAGAVVAFYLMGVDSAQRNNPAYSYLHDEIDIELVGSLWRESSQIADDATWINAFYHHTTLVLPRHANDDAGGSILTAATKKTADEALFNRQVLPDIDQGANFVGHDFNDGRYYIYTIDYSDQQITYTVAGDDGVTLKSYTLKRNGTSWPQTKMYLALTIWSTNDSSIQSNFTGFLDQSFGRPMSATIDYVSYQPAPGEPTVNALGWHGQLPWSNCPATTAASSAASSLDCHAYNRDGISCAQVGFTEGEQGSPWGESGGQFRCINNCLQWFAP